MKGTMGLSQASGKPENVKAPPVYMGVVSPSCLLRPAPRQKQKPRPNAGAVAYAIVGSLV